MRDSAQREKVRFTSGGPECVAWHYPETNAACVVMAGGFAVTKEPGTRENALIVHQHDLTLRPITGPPEARPDSDTTSRRSITGRRRSQRSRVSVCAL